MQSTSNSQRTGEAQSASKINYSALTSARSVWRKSAFWGWLFGGLVGGTGLFILGVMATSAGLDSVGPAMLTIGFLGTFVPAGLYANTHKNRHIKQFASDNNLSFQPLGRLPDYNGVLRAIDRVSSIMANSLLTCRDERFSHMGNLSFHMQTPVPTDSGKLERRHEWGFVSVDLPREVPRIFLDSRKNSGLFWLDRLPFNIDRSQRLNMENGFNEVFTLYAPLNYAHDAHYIFRPEVLEVLLSAASTYDIELSGNKLYVYRMKRLDMMKPVDIEEMLAIARLLKQSFYETTKLYKDSYQQVLSDSQKSVASQQLRAK